MSRTVPTADRVRALLADWTTLNVEAAARQLNVREDRAAALLREAGAAVFTRGGSQWVRGRSAAQRWREKPEAR